MKLLELDGVQLNGTRIALLAESQSLETLLVNGASIYDKALKEFQAMMKDVELVVVVD